MGVITILLQIHVHQKETGGRAAASTFCSAWPGHRIVSTGCDATAFELDVFFCLADGKVLPRAVPIGGASSAPGQSVIAPAPVLRLPRLPAALPRSPRMGLDRSLLARTAPDRAFGDSADRAVQQSPSNARRNRCRRRGSKIRNPDRHATIQLSLPASMLSFHKETRNR